MKQQQSCSHLTVEQVPNLLTEGNLLQQGASTRRQVSLAKPLRSGSSRQQTVGEISALGAIGVKAALNTFRIGQKVQDICNSTCAQDCCTTSQGHAWKQTTMLHQHHWEEVRRRVQLYMVQAHELT